MRASLLCNALLALGVIVVLLVGPSDSRAAFELVRASGALSLSNSREGGAILDGQGLRPGSRVSGSVTIGSPAGARLALEVTGGSETAGAGGVRLWEHLRISVADASGVVYQGRVADLGQLALGTLAAGERRGYTIAAWLPGEEAGNALQGARLSLTFTWLAEAAAAPTPTPTPTAPPADPTPVAPPPAPATPEGGTPAPVARDPNTTVTAQRLITLPPAKQCVSRRTVRVKVAAPSGVNVKSVTATVNGRQRGSTSGAKATITLRGLPKGTVRVQVTATLTSGRKLTLKRTYRTCAKRRAGSKRV